MANINAKIRNAETISAKNITIGNINTTDIGLGNVNNTSDADKPISTLTQAALDLKANQSTTYTKSEVDTNIAAIVGGAPENLNTLNELAEALNDDTSFANTLTNLIANKADRINAQFTDTATFANDVVITDDLTVDTDTLFVDASRSNVGIGTTTPDVNVKLDVAGSFRATDTAYLTSDVYLDTNTLFVDSSTNKVQIGDYTTAKQKGKLTVVGSSGSGTGLAVTHHTSTTDFAEMYYRGNATGSPFIITRSQTGGSEIILYRNGDINFNGGFGSGSGSNTSKTPDNVGIGVNAATKLNNGSANTNGKPTNKLHIFEKNGQTLGITTSTASAVNKDGAIVRIEENTASSGTNMYLDGNSIYGTSFLALAADNDIVFQPGKSTPSMTLKADGKVGIGTTPSTTLDVDGIVTATSGIITDDLMVDTNTLKVDSSTSSVGIGKTTAPERTLDVDGHFRLLVSPENRVAGESTALIKGTGGRAANLSVQGPIAVTHDLFKNSGVTNGFADNSNHFHDITKINRITRQGVGEVKNIERVQEQYYAIQSNNLRGSNAAFWNFGRVSRSIDNTSVSLTDLSGWNVQNIQDSSNRSNSGQVPFTQSETTTFTFDTSNPFANGDILQISINIDFEGPIVAATHFAKVTAVNGLSADVVLYNGSYKSTNEVKISTAPGSSAQTAVTTNFSVSKIDTSTNMLPSSGGFNAGDVFQRSFRTLLGSHGARTGRRVFKFNHNNNSAILNLRVNDVLTIITTGEDEGGKSYKEAEVATVISVSTSQVVASYGRIFDRDPDLPTTYNPNKILAILKGTLDGLHRITSGDTLMNFNADNAGRYKSFQIGPGNEVDGNCIAIGKNVYNNIDKSVRIGYEPDSSGTGDATNHLLITPTYTETIKPLSTQGLQALKINGEQTAFIDLTYDAGIHRFRDFDENPNDMMVIRKASSPGVGMYMPEAVVGINTDTPDCALHIVGQGARTDNMVLKAIGSGLFSSENDIALHLKVDTDNNTQGSRILKLQQDSTNENQGSSERMNLGFIGTGGGGTYTDSTPHAAFIEVENNRTFEIATGGKAALTISGTSGQAQFSDNVVIANGKVITAQTAPSQSYHLANKGYVDNQIGGVVVPVLGIADTNTVVIDSSTVAADEVAVFTSSGLKSRTYTEVFESMGFADSTAQIDINNITVRPVTYANNQDAYLLKGGASNNASWDGIGFKFKSDSDGSPFITARSAGANGADTMTWKGTKVGIGTISPSVELEVNGDALITGDLTVNGTTTTVNQTNIDVSDNIIGLNRGVATNASDSGLIIERGSAGDNAAVIWDESELEFVLGTTTSDASSIGNISVTPSPLRLDSIKLESGPTLTSGGSTELTITTDYGNMQIGPRNASYGHIYTDRDKFYFNKKLIVDEGIVSAYSDHDLILTTGSGPTTSSTGVFIKNSTHEVGIGTNTPAAKLDVSGYVRANYGNYLGYKNADVHDYDSSTSTSTYYWIKVGNISSSSYTTKLSVEINTFGDNNYPRNQSFTVTAQTYGISSVSLSVFKNYGGGYDGTIDAKVDSNLDLWVKKQIRWSHNFLIKPIVIDGGASFNDDFTGANRISTEPSGGTPIIRNDRFVRFAQSDLSTVTHEHSDQHFRVDGYSKLTIKADSGNVGVGTTSPGANLHVKGSGTIGQNPANFGDATIRVENGSMNLYVDANEIVTDDNLYLQSTKNNGQIRLAVADSTGTFEAIANATSTGFSIGGQGRRATRKLDVNGDAIIRGFNSDTHRPLLILDTPRGANGNQQTRLTIGSDLTTVPFEIQTATNNNVVVSSDYRIEKNTSGASKHEFRIANSNILEVDSSGITVTGTATANTAAAGTNSTVLATTEFVTTAVANNPPSGIFGTNVVVNGADFEVNNATRRLVNGQEPTNPANTTRRRAVVHNTSDTLVINFAADYTGGTQIQSDLIVGSTDLTDSNFLYFRGLTSDNDVSDVGTHTALVERLYDGNDKSELLIFKGNDTGTTNLDRIRYRSGEHIFQTIDQSEEVDEHIAADATGATNTRMIIDKAGNVGIGTDSPDHPLHVEFSGDDGVKIKSTDNLASLYVDSPSGRYIRFQDTTSSTAGPSAKYWIHSTSGSLVFRPAGTTTATNQIHFDSSGNVGIGTTSPSTELDVAGDITTEGVAINCAATSGADLAVQVDKLKVNSSTGEVGINKTADSGVDLDVNGIIKASGAVTAGQLLLGDDWDTNSPAGGDRIYIKDSDAPNYSEFALSGIDTDGNNNTTAVKSDFPLLISTDSNETSNPTSHGILLYNANGTAGTFSPSILFGTRESDAQGGAPNHQYRVVSGGIYCRTPLGVGGESSGHYGDGELIFATAGTENGSTTANSQGPSQRMVIDRSGRVGINNLTPSEVLDVTGNIAASGNVTATDVTASGDITATGDIVVSGSGNTNYNGTYVYDSTEDIWYNNTNTSATSGNKGYFFYSDTDNRWQFSSTNTNAKEASGSTLNSFLSPSTSEVAGFWAIDENTNWTAGNATVTGHAQSMSFAGSDITATGNVIASDPTADEHLATKRYVDSRSALPTISVFTYYNNSVTTSGYLATYADQDSGNNLAFAGTSLETALPDTTGDKNGEFTVPSSGKSLVEIRFHTAEGDNSSGDDYRLWILDKNRSTNTGVIAVAPRKNYNNESNISWAGYIAPGGKFTVYIQEVSDASGGCEVQGSVKITTYDV